MLSFGIQLKGVSYKWISIDHVQCVLNNFLFEELRKLKMRHLGIEGKYKKWDIIKEHADHTSELYAPLLRHGVHPKRLHQQFDEHLKEYRAQYMGKTVNYNAMKLYL